MGLRTLAQIQEEFDAARKAKLEIMKAQSAGIGDKTIQRARLSEINAESRRRD